MHGMMDLQLLKRRLKERLREAEMHRLAKALRATHKQRADNNKASALAWELKRIAGRRLTLLRVLKDTDRDDNGISNLEHLAEQRSRKVRGKEKKRTQRC